MKITQGLGQYKMTDPDRKTTQNAFFVILSANLDLPSIVTVALLCFKHLHPNSTVFHSFCYFVSVGEIQVESNRGQK